MPFSGELLAMVVIGGMRQHPRAGAGGALLHPVPRAVLDARRRTGCSGSGCCSSASSCSRRAGSSASGRRLHGRWRPPPEEAAAMNARRVHAGLPLPAFLRPAARRGTVLEVDGVQQALRRHPRGRRCESHHQLRRGPRADRPERRRQDHAVQPRVGHVHAGRGHGTSARRGDSATCRRTASASGASRARSRSPTCFAACRSARTCASRCRHAPRAFQRLARRRQLPRGAGGDAPSWSGSSASRASRRSRAASSPTAGSACWTSASRSPPSRRCCCSTSRSWGLRRPSASACRTWSEDRRRQHPGTDRRARHRPRARLRRTASP